MTQFVNLHRPLVGYDGMFYTHQMRVEVDSNPLQNPYELLSAVKAKEGDIVVVGKQAFELTKDEWHKIVTPADIRRKMM